MIDLLWVLLCSGLVFLMQAGFMCLESGFTRSKNSINVAVKNIADFGLSVALFWLYGYALMFGQSFNGWVGGSQFLVSPDNQSQLAVFFLFQAMFCGTATTIISGAIAERLKFKAYLIVAGLVSGLIYPLFGHWAWKGIFEQNGQGWLRNLGFFDFAGSTVVHSIGAWVSLATLLIIGARTGRYKEQGESKKIQGSNLPFSVLGALLLWFGWIGFNGGSSLGFTAQVPLIVVNTMMAGVAGLITAGVLSGWRWRYLQVEWLVNGAIAGLVAITACCNIVSTPLAVIIGATGAAVMILIDYYLNRWKIDDAVGAVAVHGGAGAWGTLCVAFFGQLELINTGLNRFQQLFIQLLGVSVAFLWAFGISWLILKAVNQFSPLRVSLEEEQLGLNITEHQAKTDTYELFEVMDWQARTQDLSRRVPVDPFTEVGHIATRYNQVMDALETKNQQSITYLEKIYEVTALAAASLDKGLFDPTIFDSFVSEDDELGMLAQVLQRMSQFLADKDNKSVYTPVKCLQNLLLEVLENRFGEVSSQTVEQIQAISDVETLKELLKASLLSQSKEAFEKQF